MEMELIFYDGNFKSVNEVEFSEEADAMAAVSFFFEVKNGLISLILLLLGGGSTTTTPSINKPFKIT